MDFVDIEIIDRDGKYGLVNRISQSTVLDPFYEHIWAYDFLGEDGAFILSRECAYYLYDVAKDVLSEAYASMFVFDTRFFAVSQNQKDYKLFNTISLFDEEEGYAERDDGDCIFFHVEDKVGLGVIGFNGGPNNEPTVVSYFNKYRLESILLYPEFDEISPLYGEYITFSNIEAKRNGLRYLYSFESQGDKYSLSKGLDGKGYEQIKYGKYYVSAFRDGFWEMYRGGTCYVGRSKEISSGYSNPYLLIDGKLQIGETLACDSIDEIIEKNWGIGCYFRFAIYKTDGKCGLWQFEGSREQSLKPHYNSIIPLYHGDYNGDKEVTHFIVSDEKDQKGVFELKRGCFIISCSYKNILPVTCSRADHNGHIEIDTLMGFVVSGFLPNSTGILGPDGEIICPLHFSNPASEDIIKEKMLTFVHESCWWKGDYIGEDERPVYILRAKDGCYAYNYLGRRIIDQPVDSISIYQPNREWEYDYFLIVKRGDKYGLYWVKMGLKVIEDISCDEIRLIEDLECFLIVKNGESSLYSFKDQKE